MFFDPLHNRAEVGIMVDKSCRRQGIGRNALALLEEHCFRYSNSQLFAYISLWKTFLPADSLRRAQREAVLKVGAIRFGGGYTDAGCPEAESQLRGGYWG